jgi:hypothetical protein
MSRKFIKIGPLPKSANETDIRKLFTDFKVSTVDIIGNVAYIQLDEFTKDDE